MRHLKPGSVLSDKIRSKIKGEVILIWLKVKKKKKTSTTDKYIHNRENKENNRE